MKKGQMLLLEIMKWVLIALLLAIFIYIILIAIPKADECKLKCTENQPYGELLIEYDTPSFENICYCYYSYSYSIKNFDLGK